MEAEVSSLFSAVASDVKESGRRRRCRRNVPRRIERKFEESGYIGPYIRTQLVVGDQFRLVNA